MLRVALWTVGGLVAAAILLVLTYLIWFAIASRPRRRPEPGFEYIWVEDDGAARELNREEQSYVSTDFSPFDGGRPYIKMRYETRTPDGRLSGYLRRRQVPSRISIRPL